MARQNDHVRAEELISAYLDKRITAEEKSFFERHIASCADCHAQLESTRAMVAALRAMPLVKAPRSFVLPRELARQPRRSFLPSYPALRLATVVAALAFVILFAGDVLINQPGGGSVLQSIPAAAPAPGMVQAPEAARQAVPTQEATDTALYSAAPAEPPSAAGDATSSAAADAATPEAAAKAAMSGTAVMTESATVLILPTATPEPALQAQVQTEATPEAAITASETQAEAAVDQARGANLPATAPGIEPLRILEIVLLVLAVGFGVAALAARRKQT